MARALEWLTLTRQFAEFGENADVLTQLFAILSAEVSDISFSVFQ